VSTQREEWLSVLELDASRADIDEAWRQLVQVWHPDRFVHNRQLQLKAENKLKQINEAHRNLTNIEPARTKDVAADPSLGTASRTPC
jgi:curved DNA-binding protein CbpA